jgi:hypothetical protein
VINHPATEITFVTEVAFALAPTFIDAEGTLELELSMSSSAAVGVQPVSVPTHLVFENIKRVSVKMPAPGQLDQLGRPQ